MTSKAVAQSTVDLGDTTQLVFENGTLGLRVQDRPVWSKHVADASDEASHHLATYALDDETLALHAVLETKETTREWVGLLKKGKTRVQIVWDADTRMTGDIGERTGTSVQFTDLTGDGKPEIVVGEVSEAVKLCGQKNSPLLFRRVFDLKTSRFRPILAKRPGMGVPIDIAGSASPEPPPRPLIDPILASSASRSADDRGETLFLSKPRVAVDRDPATWWSPWPGNGAGEFATFNTATSVYGITTLGIRPHTGSLKKSSYDRPKSMLLKTETTTYRLNFTTDAATAPDQIYWFAFPSPVKSACLSVIVESSFEPTLGTPIGIADIFATTEIDGVAGLTRLAADLGNEQLRRQASILLERVGKDAVLPIRSTWKSLDRAGRRLAVEVVGRVDPKGGMAILVSAALGKDAIAKDRALEGMMKAPNAAVAQLKSQLKKAASARFPVIVDTIAFLGTPAALDALAEIAGQGANQTRRYLRGALRRVAAEADVDGEILWNLISKAREQGVWEKQIDLLLVAVINPVLHDRIFEIADGAYDKKARFEDRYRLLEVLGQLDCRLSRDRLFSAARDSDLQIRAVALLGIGGCRGGDDAPKMTAALQQGLRDTATPVRLAALTALSSADIVDALAPEVKHAAISDAWPTVRARAVALVRRLSPDRALSILETTENDSSSIVREASLEAALGFHTSKADRIIERRLTDPKEIASLKLRAAVAAGKRCQSNALPALFDLLKVGAEPLAPFESVEVAVAAARAMGEIGTPKAKEMLEQARRRSNPATDKAIDDALKRDSRCTRSGGDSPPIPVSPE